MRVALVGFGSVGQATARLLEERSSDLYAREGLLIRLVCVADSRGAAINEHGLKADDLFVARAATGSVSGVPGHGLKPEAYSTLPRLIRDVSADVLIEASPSSIANPMPAFENLKAALSSAMHVVSVNKAPLAVAMPALRELARFNRVQLRFSGAVGAGTPVLSTARSLSRGDEIIGVRAILNGTTNFILWKMLEEQRPYSEALAEAQKLGYAETDPSADIDGVDTATKVVILSSALLTPEQEPATIHDVQVHGIRDIPMQRLTDAAARGKVIKLIGSITTDAGHAGGETGEAARERNPRRLALRVAPEEVDRHGPMDVPRNLNAVQFTTRRAGEVTLVGAGAGGVQTATAIVRDLVDIWHSAHPEIR